LIHCSFEKDKGLKGGDLSLISTWRQQKCMVPSLWIKPGSLVHIVYI
jgi:hypothetical protein